MTVKVIVSGPFSTGKTTTVTDLRAALCENGLSVRVVPDAARHCPFHLNELQGGEGSLWLACTQVAAEQAAMVDGADVVLCDRGVPDVVAHHLDAPGLGKGGLFDEGLPFFLEWCRTYDVILEATVNAAISVVPDGLRVPSDDYRARVAIRHREVLAGLAQSLALPEDREARVGYAVAVIRKALTRPASARG